MTFIYLKVFSFKNRKLFSYSTTLLPAVVFYKIPSLSRLRIKSSLPRSTLRFVLAQTWFLVEASLSLFSQFFWKPFPEPQVRPTQGNYCFFLNFYLYLRSRFSSFSFSNRATVCSGKFFLSSFPLKLISIVTSGSALFIQDSGNLWGNFPQWTLWAWYIWGWKT